MLTSRDGEFNRVDTTETMKSSEKLREMEAIKSRLDVQVDSRMVSQTRLGATLLSASATQDIACVAT